MSLAEWAGLAIPGDPQSDLLLFRIAGDAGEPEHRHELNTQRIVGFEDDIDPNRSAVILI